MTQFEEIFILSIWKVRKLSLLIHDLIHSKPTADALVCGFPGLENSSPCHSVEPSSSKVFGVLP